MRDKRQKIGRPESRVLSRVGTWKDLFWETIRERRHEHETKSAPIARARGSHCPSRKDSETCCIDSEIESFLQKPETQIKIEIPV